MAPSSAQLRDSIRVAIRKEKSDTFLDLSRRHAAIHKAGSIQTMLFLLTKAPNKSRAGRLLRALLTEYREGPHRRLAGNLLLWATLPVIEGYCKNVGEWLRNDTEQAGCLAVLECAHSFKPGSRRDSKVFGAFVERVITYIREQRDTEALEARIWCRHDIARRGAANDDVERVQRGKRIKFARGEWNEASGALRAYCARRRWERGVEDLVATLIKGHRFEDFVRKHKPTEDFQRAVVLSRKQKARLVLRLRDDLKELYEATAPAEVTWLMGANDDVPMVRLLGLADEADI